MLLEARLPAHAPQNAGPEENGGGVGEANLQGFVGVCRGV